MNFLFTPKKIIFNFFSINRRKLLKILQILVHTLYVQEDFLNGIPIKVLKEERQERHRRANKCRRIFRGYI